MADEKNRLGLLKEIENAEARIKRAKESTVLSQLKINKYVDEQKDKIVELAKELKKVNQETLNEYSNMEQSLGSISGAYASLKDNQKAALTLAAGDDRFTGKKLQSLQKVQDLNQQISQLGRDDIHQKAALMSMRDEEMAKVTEGIHGNSKIVQTLKEQNSLAEDYSNLTAFQKTQMENTHKVLEGIKGTLGGVLDVFSTLTSGVMGGLGVGLIGAGIALDKLGQTARETGSLFNEMSVSATVFGLVFKDATAVAKGLATELGGVEQSTFGAQFNANLLATNLNLSGAETAKLIGGFARLGDGTAQAGADMAQLVYDASKAAGVIPADVAGDLAANTEKFAEYGKDGGKNMIQAAIAAKKLGLEMSSLTNVTDGLLDIENSLTSELELGALLGKNINFEQARRLAYEGEIGSAVKSAINQLGGVEEFNKMDIYQKREAAKALGLSVEELQKMTTNMDKLNADGSLQVSTFDRIGQTMSALAKGPLGSFVKGVGGAAIAMGQMGFDVKGIASKMPILGKFINKIPAKGDATSSISKPTTPSPSKGDPSKLTKSISKIKMTDVVKGAAALVLIAGAMFILGKALQEFQGIGFDTLKVAGLALLGLTLSLAAVGGIMSFAGPMILAGAGAMILISGAMFILGKALQEIAQVPADFNFVSLGAQLLAFGLAITPLGFLSPLIMLAAASLGIMGAGLTLFGIGLRMIPFETLNLVKDTLTNVVPLTGGILSLAAGITALAGSLMFLGLAGITALPGLMALSMVGGISMALGGLFGGDDEGGGEDSMEALLTEIQGLRQDLNAGKVAVYLDGAKVTSGIRNVVNGTKVNSYGL
jgi:hypothetical protein